jgi:endonuclease/exonuclease/phosphatase family metal-dependent hydrolase
LSSTCTTSAIRRRPIIAGGVYREWGGTAKEKEEAVATLEALMMIASSITRHFIVLGDFNLDLHKSKDTRYNQRPLLVALDNAVAAAGLRYFATIPTYRSHGSYQRHGEPEPEHEPEYVHRISCIDHVYASKDVTALGTVLADATTDHPPVLAEVVINAEAVTTTSTRMIQRRKTKYL